MEINSEIIQQLSMCTGTHVLFLCVNMATTHCKNLNQANFRQDLDINFPTRYKHLWGTNFEELTLEFNHNLSNYVKCVTSENRVCDSYNFLCRLLGIFNFLHTETYVLYRKFQNKQNNPSKIKKL